MRHNTAFHDVESIFYIGVPLVLFSIGLSCLPRLFGGPLLGGLSAAALLVFALSSFQMGRVGHDRQASEYQEAVVADFEHIRTITEAGQSVFVPRPVWWGPFVPAPQFAGGEGAHLLYYYLAGRMIGIKEERLDSAAFDFLVSRHRVAVPALLTPENRQIFLYRRTDYSALMDEMIRQSELVIRHDGYVDVYRSGNRLVYVRNSGEDRAAQFRQNNPIVGKPIAVRLSSAVHDAGFTDRSAWQWERGSDAEGWTNVSDSPSPTYLYTPTIADEGQRLRAYAFYTDSHGNRVKARTRSSLPVQQSSITGIGFLLHGSPVDVDDLPDHRKQHGFDNLDFRFDNYRIPHRARDVAVRELPAYDVGSIRTD